ncbi:MAG: hypothetical protein JWP97_3620 [Labilithrix sp.]|nr:hypothetical protein [Labilithrix sp.]
MRSSSLLVVGLASAVVALASGCRVEAHSQTAFEVPATPVTYAGTWTGQPITIENAGINPLGGTGGVEVKVDPAATTIKAEATLSALADDDKEPDARASLDDVAQTLQITESGGVLSVTCGHGQAHGTSGVAGSGCKILRVTIPAGSAVTAHRLTVGNGMGDVRIGLAEAGTYPYVQSLAVNNNGLGDVNVRVSPVDNAGVLALKGGGALAVALPSSFSAQKVTFIVDEDDQEAARARIVASGFAGMQSGLPYPATGASATAAQELTVTSTGPFASDTITVTPF